MRIFKRLTAILMTLCLLAPMTATAEGETRYDPYDENTAYAGYTPNFRWELASYPYSAFKEIFDLYLKTHLYEFSAQELSEAFIMNLLRNHPDLYTLFVDTLLTSMDKYSMYYEAGTGLNTDGSTKGYGIGVGDENSYSVRDMGFTEPGVYVTRVLYNSQALRAGICVGDKILEVEGYSTEGLTAESVMEYLSSLPFVEAEAFDEAGNSLGIPNEPKFIIDSVTGKKIYPVHLKLQRGEDIIIDVELTRGNMLPSPVSYSIMPDNSYAYIQIASFQGETVAQDFYTALTDAEDKKVKNLVLDLRNNGGGLVENAQQMANMLIRDKDRLLFYINSRQHEEPQAIYSEGDGMTFENISVLVNENTASAAEAFAMMLAYNCNTTIVGNTTYGKGVGQQSYMMSNGDMFTVTSFEILDPRKKSYNNVGITPDVECSPALTKYQFPEKLEVLNHQNYKTLYEGQESDRVMGLELRLAMMGILRYEKADGIFDGATTAAIDVLGLVLGKRPDGMLDDMDISEITRAVNGYKNYYYNYDSQMDVAVMVFQSRSQAKRLAKEIERDSAKVEAERQEYFDELEKLDEEEQ